MRWRNDSKKTRVGQRPQKSREGLLVVFPQRRAVSCEAVLLENHMLIANVR